MSEKRLNNTIYIMYLVTENYKKAHSLTTEQFMNLDQKYNIIKSNFCQPEIKKSFDFINFFIKNTWQIKITVLKC